MKAMRWSAVGALLLATAACGGAGGGGVSGTVTADGSSTVYPVTEAAAVEFRDEFGSGVRVMVAMSGTGGGFRRFCAGETDLSNASRHISEREAELCAQNGVEYVELPIALDGMAVVVNPTNTFAQCLSVAELRRIWEPNSTVQLWSQVREGWPAERIRLYAPGTASGTFDYFTEAVMGEVGASRADFTASEDDNVLVQGVEGDRFALAYFGLAYFEENQGRLRLVDIDGGTGCVTPTPETIRTGTYSPLSRPLFLYVNRASLQRPEVATFVRFYLDHAADIARSVGYVPVGAEQTEETRRLFDGAAPAAQPAGE
jgi:phosphate transport system substrate-binding protein